MPWGGQVSELLQWLGWVERWTAQQENKAVTADGRDRRTHLLAPGLRRSDADRTDAGAVQSLIQHYVEPTGGAQGPGGGPTFSSATYAVPGMEMETMPLGEGVMTRSV